MEQRTFQLPGRLLSTHFLPTILFSRGKNKSHVHSVQRQTSTHNFLRFVLLRRDGRSRKKSFRGSRETFHWEYQSNEIQWHRSPLHVRLMTKKLAKILFLPFMNWFHFSLSRGLLQYGQDWFSAFHYRMSTSHMFMPLPRSNKIWIWIEAVVEWKGANKWPLTSFSLRQLQR